MAAPQSHAVEPAQAEVEPETPELGRCKLRRVMIASAPGGRLEEHEVVIAEGSGLTFMFVRSLKDAIYGQVWSALVVTLHDRGESGSSVAFYRVVLDATGNQRRLAVKRMPWDIINRKMRKNKENPLHEIAFLTRMQDPGHPNVVGLEEALDDGTTVYLATPFVGGAGGGEMFDWVADNYLNPAPGAVIRPLLRQILEGTGYIHSKGICHADMSLENTLVNLGRTKAFIIDFGMALQMPTDEHGRRCKSIPDGRRAKKSYRAPETHKGRDAYDGVKVDMFSVGCMAFMMFTGIPPFDEATRIDSKFRKSIYKGDLQGYLRDYGMGPLPEPVFRVLSKMMAYKPEDRPTPEELLRDPWFAPIGVDSAAEQQQVQAQAQPAQVQRPAPAAAAAPAAPAPVELYERVMMPAVVSQVAAPGDAAAASGAPSAAPMELHERGMMPAVLSQAAAPGDAAAASGAPSARSASGRSAMDL